VVLYENSGESFIMFIIVKLLFNSNNNNNKW